MGERFHRSCVRTCESGWIGNDLPAVQVDRETVHKLGFHLQYDDPDYDPTNPNYALRSITGILAVLWAYRDDQWSPWTPTLDDIAAHYPDPYVHGPVLLTDFQPDLRVLVGLVATAIQTDPVDAPRHGERDVLMETVETIVRLHLDTEEDPFQTPCGRIKVRLERGIVFTGDARDVTAGPWHWSATGTNALGHDASTTLDMWPLGPTPELLPTYDGPPAPCNLDAWCGHTAADAILLLPCQAGTASPIFADPEGLASLPGTGPTYKIDGRCYHEAGTVPVDAAMVTTPEITERFDACEQCTNPPELCAKLRNCSDASDVVFVPVGLLAGVQGDGAVYRIDGICRTKIGELVESPTDVTDIAAGTYPTCTDCVQDAYRLIPCRFLAGTCQPQHAPPINVDKDEWEAFTRDPSFPSYLDKTIRRSGPAPGGGYRFYFYRFAVVGPVQNVQTTPLAELLQDTWGPCPKCFVEPPDGPGVKPPTVSVPPSTDRPGTALKSLLGRIGITPSPDCTCNERAAEMDRRGSEWVLANIETVVGWLRDEAGRRKTPFSALAARSLVRLAVRTARKGRT